MSYYNITNDYYQPPSPGTPGWQLAPVPGWGMNPARSGPAWIAANGVGATLIPGYGYRTLKELREDREYEEHHRRRLDRLNRLKKRKRGVRLGPTSGVEIRSIVADYAPVNSLGDSEEAGNQGKIALGVAGGIFLGWALAWVYWSNKSPQRRK